jgi:hypothetical protein
MANQHTKRLEIETKAKADRDAQPPAHEPDPIPEGRLFTVHAFGQDGKRVEAAEKSVFGGGPLAACSHSDAVTECGKANDTKIASTEAVWFGVVGITGAA